MGGRCDGSPQARERRLLCFPRPSDERLDSAFPSLASTAAARVWCVVFGVKKARCFGVFGGGSFGFIHPL